MLIFSNVRNWHFIMFIECKCLKIYFVFFRILYNVNGDLSNTEINYVFRNIKKSIK